MTSSEGFTRRHLLRMAGAVGVGVAAGPGAGSLLAACSRGSDDDTLKVGVIAPFTGARSFVGSVVSTSLDASVAQLNASGGIGGRKVELLLRDTASDADRGSRVYDALSRDEALVGVLWCGTPGLSRTLPRIKAAGLPVVTVFEDLFSTGGLFPAGDASGRSVFQISIPDLYAKQVLAEYASADRGYTSGALLYDAGLDPEGLTRRNFETAFQGAGLTVRAVESFTGTDFRPQLERIRATAPQVLYLEGLSDACGAIVSRLSATTAAYVDTPTAKGPVWHPHVFGSLQGVVNELWAAAGGEAAKVGTVAAWHVGGLAPLSSYQIRQWLARFLGKEPLGGEEFPADALFTILRGVEQAGTVDRQRVVRAIETMGPVTFASVGFGFAADRHVATTRDDVVILTLERLRGPAPTEPPYELGSEWGLEGAFTGRAAAPTLLVRPTLEANRRAHPGVMDEVLRTGYGTQCTERATGLTKECKIH